MQSDAEFWDEDTKNRILQSSAQAWREGREDLAQRLEWIARNYGEVCTFAKARMLGHSVTVPDEKKG